MNIYEFAEKKKVSIRQVLDFTLLSNPLGPSNKTRTAIRAALRTVPLSPDPQTRRLRRYIAKNARVEPENILFGHGSTLLLDLILASTDPKKVLIPGPLPDCYGPLLDRRKIVPLLFSLPAPEAPLDLQALAPLLDQADMLLIPNPHWMTGRLLPLSALRALIPALQGTHKTLVLDEGLAEFAGGAFPAEEAVRTENMLLLRTFSLFHALAGLRLGYLLGNRQALDRIEGFLGAGPVGSVAAAGALASLKDGEFTQRTAEFLKTEKAYLMGKIGRIEEVRIEDTSYNFLLVKPKDPAIDLEEALLARSILVTGFKDDDGASILRVAVRRHRENARFAKTLGRIAFGWKRGSKT